MLILSRRRNERIRIEFAGAYIWVTVASVGDVSAKIGIDAPKDAVILREEVIDGPYANDSQPMDGHSV